MFNNLFEGKTVLVTGNSGFKGSWLTLWLIKLGARVIGISNNHPSNPSMFNELNIREYMEDYFEYDISLGIDGLSKAFEYNPDIVFHLAAQPLVSESYEDPLNTLQTNIIGTANVLDLIRNNNKKTTGVIITSDKCYDNLELERGYNEEDLLGGKDIYSGSKGAAELVFKAYFHSFFKGNSLGSKISTTRAGNVIGGGDWGKDRIVPDAIRSWSNDSLISIRSPRSTRPWQHVLEPLSGYLMLAQKLLKDEVNNGVNLNFGPNEENKKNVSELILDMSKVWGFKNPEESFQISEVSNFHEASLLQLDCSKAKKELGWGPLLNYEEMIDLTIGWYKKFYSDKDEMLDYSINQINSYEKLALKRGMNWAS
ncbi:MAG: CDP-glucose 4,6-dehydratase [Chloroflexi bacterium]|nr:CDP-glucose 4,6-dehydratase [Chloroflexota bacterium]|tara:strand:+ start:2657 stop:3760 length:1104 start_codon:yes stop_codon:yes gene_type:complete